MAERVAELIIRAKGANAAAEDLRKVGKASKGASSEVSKLGQAGGKSISSLALGVKGLVVGMAGLSFGKAISGAMKFNTQVRQIGLRAGLSGMELAAFGDSARRISQETGAELQGVMAGLSDLTTSGFSADEALRIMQTIAPVAEATGENMADMVRGAAQAAKQFGMTADEFTTLLYTASQFDGAVANVDALAKGFADMAVSARTIGVAPESMVKLQAALAVATNDANAANAVIGDIFRKLAAPQAAMNLRKIFGAGFSKKYGAEVAESIFADPAKLLQTLADEYIAMQSAGDKNLPQFEQLLFQAVGLRREAVADFKAAIGAFSTEGQAVVNLDAASRERANQRMGEVVSESMGDPAKRFNEASLEFQNAVTPLIPVLTEFAKSLTPFIKLLGGDWRALDRGAAAKADVESIQTQVQEMLALRRGGGGGATADASAPTVTMPLLGTGSQPNSTTTNTFMGSMVAGSDTAAPTAGPTLVTVNLQSETTIKDGVAQTTVKRDGQTVALNRQAVQTAQ